MCVMSVDAITANEGTIGEIVNWGVVDEEKERIRCSSEGTWIGQSADSDVIEFIKRQTWVSSDESGLVWRGILSIGKGNDIVDLPNEFPFVREEFERKRSSLEGFGDEGNLEKLAEFGNNKRIVRCC